MRSETLPALMCVTSWHVPGAVTVVGAHQRVSERRDASAAMLDVCSSQRDDEVVLLSEASAVSECVEEQRLAVPRSWTMYVDESEV